jgi:DNA-directed RNA polymerase specialized sigma24 family protein
MADASVPRAQSKKVWHLTEAMFHQLLRWLDEGENSNGSKYLEMRRRLVSYFRRKGCNSPDDLADETLNRVARRLKEEGSIDTTPAQYCHIVARFVLLEYYRGPNRNLLSFEGIPDSDRPSVVDFNSKSGDAELKNRLEQRLDCLEHCLNNFDPEDRELIFQYYQGEQRIKIENRRALAARLGLTPNALSIRACRIRDKLEGCVRHCLRGTKEFGNPTLSIEDRPNSE